jgi:hypothetical protein
MFDGESAGGTAADAEVGAAPADAEATWETEPEVAGMFMGENAVTRVAVGVCGKKGSSLYESICIEETVGVALAPGCGMRVVERKSGGGSVSKSWVRRRVA